MIKKCRICGSSENIKYRINDRYYCEKCFEHSPLLIPAIQQWAKECEYCGRDILPEEKYYGPRQEVFCSECAQLFKIWK